MFGEVSRESRHTIRTHPDAAVRDFDVRENLRNWELIELALRRFAGIGSKRSDVDQTHNSFVGSRGGNEAATVRVPDEDGRAADSTQRAFYCGDITFRCVEAVLRGNHFLPFRLQCWDYLAEA